MVRPTPVQSAGLDRLRERVLLTMQGMAVLGDVDRSSLRLIPLGLLRKSATQRHGVTRWIRHPSGKLSVETVDLHPRLLDDEWSDYAAFVLFHEYLHALGWRAHDRTFRTLEATWPDTQASLRGPDFTRRMREGKATWYWRCPSCEHDYPRQRKAGGQYLCRTCRHVLQDVPAEDAQ